MSNDPADKRKRGTFTLPTRAAEFLDWTWEKFEPYIADLGGRALAAANVEEWLADWTAVSDVLSETGQRLSVATTLDTTDAEAERRYNAYLDGIYLKARAAEQALKAKFLAAGVAPAGFEVPLRNLRAEADLYREANLPLQTEEKKIGAEYDKVIGAQTIQWEGKEVTLSQLAPVYLDPDRSLRERAWRMAAGRQLADRAAIDSLWGKLLAVRRKLAANADCPDYRAFRWRQFLRFDYTPEDCARFHDAIERAVVPAAARIHERRRERLGLKALRPWDLRVDPLGRAPLRPFAGADELIGTAQGIFDRVDPVLGGYYRVLREEKLLDLDNRKGKAPGGYCTHFPVARRPFIFMNAVGVHNDVQTLLHESGHAFHDFEADPLPFHQQKDVGMEFAEVASMAMELLAAPYLPRSRGGYYSDADAARARVEHLEETVLFWPYMAVVDAFQHWAYTRPDDAADPAACDAVWTRLWRRFTPEVDWSGLEDVLATGWHRKLHIFRYPFYYVEYGLAQLGAVQVWRGSLADPAGAVAKYRRALALGGTVPLPALYAAAGARLAFDAATLAEAVRLCEETIERLEGE